MRGAITQTAIKLTNFAFLIAFAIAILWALLLVIASLAATVSVVAGPTEATLGGAYFVFWHLCALVGFVICIVLSSRNLVNPELIRTLKIVALAAFLWGSSPWVWFETI